MIDRRLEFDVVVVGAGPAGVTAATVAAEQGQRVALLEGTPWVGGQIWRGPSQASKPRAARRWLARLQASPVERFTESTVIDRAGPNCLRVEKTAGVLEFSWQKLILAVGARERFIPFPGWTLPNVFGVGGLQLLIKGGWPVAGKRIAVAGSGPLLLALAATLRQSGAEVPLIAEQTPLTKLLSFGLTLPWLSPDKLLQAAQYKARLFGVPFRTGCWPIEAQGGDQLERVTFRSGARTWTEDCDGLACAFGLLPNLELPRLMGCELSQHGVSVDRWQQTSVPGIYCAGEPTGIGGVDRALVEGQIAGYAVADQPDRGMKLFGQRARTHRFSRMLEHTFAPREELKALATAQTLVCRCEDVTLGQIKAYDQWRAAKLQTRCGMGACQGRVCGGITEFLLGWKNESIRPPLYPARVDSLMESSPETMLKNGSR